MKGQWARVLLFAAACGILAGGRPAPQDLPGEQPQGALRDQVLQSVGEYTLVDVQSTPAAIDEGATDTVVAKYRSRAGVEIVMLAYAFPSREKAEAYLNDVVQDLQARFSYQLLEEKPAISNGQQVGKFARLLGTNEAYLVSIGPLFMGISGPEGYPLGFAQLWIAGSGFR